MYGYFHKSFSTRHPRPVDLDPRRALLALMLALLIGFLNSTVGFSAAEAALSLTTPGTAPVPASLSSRTEPEARTWQPGPVYAQIGSSCVAYSLAAWLDAEPSPVQNHPSGWQIYLAARQVDGIAHPHDGTTVPAGIQVLSRLGYVGAWKSTQDTGEALAYLRTKGPIVLETDFPQEQPVLDGEHNLEWTGRLGWHAWLCYGVDEHDRLSCQNSSGTQWNSTEGGRFHVTRATIARLLASGLAWLINKAQAAGSGYLDQSASDPGDETPLLDTFDRATSLLQH